MLGKLSTTELQPHPAFSIPSKHLSGIVCITIVLRYDRQKGHEFLCLLSQKEISVTYTYTLATPETEVIPTLDLRHLIILFGCCFLP